jgi:hypothetical protein
MKNTYKTVVGKAEKKRPFRRLKHWWWILRAPWMLNVRCNSVGWKGSNGGLWWLRQWTSGFLKRRGISLPAEWPLPKKPCLRGVDWNNPQLCTLAAQWVTSSCWVHDTAYYRLGIGLVRVGFAMILCFSVGLLERHYVFILLQLHTAPPFFVVHRSLNQTRFPCT